MRFDDVKSSWVTKLGWNQNGDLFVGTKSNKFYKVAAVSSSELDAITAAIDDGETVGALVSHLFKNFDTCECTEQEAVEATSGGVASAGKKREPGKGKRTIRAFADLLKPEARTGMLSFA